MTLYNTRTFVMSEFPPIESSSEPFYFLKRMKFGVELELLQDGYDHRPVNVEGRRRAYAEALNEHARRLQSAYLDKPYFYFRATKRMKTLDDFHENQYPDAGPYDTWVIDHDNSVKANANANASTGTKSSRRLQGNTEIISPVLSVFVGGKERARTDYGPFVLAVVMNVLLKLPGLTYETNKSTGTHVHLSCVDDDKKNNFFKNPMVLRAIILNWIRYQPVFYALVKDRTDNEHCKPLKLFPYNEGDDEGDDESDDEGDKNENSGKYIYDMIKHDYKNISGCRQHTCNNLLVGYYCGDRYFGLNLDNLIRGKRGERTIKGTLEVRLHHGTIDPKELYNWVLLLACFFDRVMTDVVVAEASDGLDDYFGVLTSDGRPVETDDLFADFVKRFVPFSYLRAYYAKKLRTVPGTSRKDAQGLASLISDISDDAFWEDPMAFSGGADPRKKPDVKYVKTSEKVMFMTRSRCVYIYRRKKYVMVKNEFVKLNATSI